MSSSSIICNFVIDTFVCLTQQLVKKLHFLHVSTCFSLVTICMGHEPCMASSISGRPTDLLLIFICRKWQHFDMVIAYVGIRLLASILRSNLKPFDMFKACVDIFFLSFNDLFQSYVLLSLSVGNPTD